MIVQKTEENRKRRWKLTILVLLALTLLYFHKTHPVQLDTFLSWRPENTLLAVITVVFVFTLKALTVFIPLRPLQIMTGHLFSASAAVAVNVLGQLIVASVPYWTGRKAGQKKVRTLLEKHPKASAILTIQNRNPLAASFFPRACAFPLGDLVTMYLGATGIPYGCNVIGSVLGCLPSMLLATFLGASIQEPDSPEFWLALILNIAWIVVSGLVFYLYRKYSVRKEVTP